MKTKDAIKKLQKMGIKTTEDLDTWITKSREQGRSYSRYSALVALVGDDAATWILNDLAINQCCHAI